MLTSAAPTAIDVAVARLDAWLETMRGPDGYGGPVAHWWQQSLLYTGTGRDWRYEGIIAGYLHLWASSGDEYWLRKAQIAGDDLLVGQLPDGHFAASGFEFNPVTAGTPHEAACDVALLLLARALRSTGRPSWVAYAAGAERNLRDFYVARLWDEATRSFHDSQRTPTFVPNKAATTCDALFLLAEITGQAEWAERYALPTLDRIIAHQVRDRDCLDGAIAQNSSGRRVISAYFPIYIARCVPALLSGYRWTGDQRYGDSALRAMRFVARWAAADGSLPTVIYANRRVSRYPSWIAPLGDVLRAADELRPYGFDDDLSATAAWLLAGQDASGGIRTAAGFAAQAGRRPGPTPDVRDVLHVAGWCDKAFRYLTTHTGSGLPTASSGIVEVACTFRGQALRLLETPEVLEIRRGAEVRYRWRKGDGWPATAAPEYWLR